MDPFEKHINDHREELDQVEHPEVGLIWQGIQQKMQAPQSRKRRIGLYWWVAAAAIILLVIAGISWWSSSSVEEEEAPTMQLADISPELARQERQYQQLIAEKEKHLQLASLDQNEFELFFRELEILEELHQEYLKVLPANAYNEKLINTLLQYYELKIRLLEQLENEVSKKHYYESQHIQQSI